MARTESPYARQSVLNLATIRDAHKDIEADRVMAGLLGFLGKLEVAIMDVKSQMRAGRDASAISEAMSIPLVHSARYGADELIDITNRATRSLSVVRPGRALSADAMADTMIWIQIALQTQVAARVLFEISFLNGLAPNGLTLDA